MSSIRQYGSALVLALASSAALASPLLSTMNVALVSDAAGGQSAGISFTHTVAGLFTDTFILNGASGFALLDGILQTSGGPSSMDIDFYSATLNNVPFTFTKTNLQSGTVLYIDFRELGSFAQDGLSSPFTLVINGRAGEGLADGARINATYSGTINVNAVPEPASAALALVGLLGAGLVARRRNA